MKRAVRSCAVNTPTTPSWHHVLFIECRMSMHTRHVLRPRRVLKMIMHSTRDNMTIKMVLNNNCLIKMLIIVFFFHSFAFPLIHSRAGVSRERRRPKRFIAKCEFHCVALWMRTSHVQFNVFSFFPTDRRRRSPRSLTKTY